MASTIKQAYEVALQQTSKNVQINNSPTPAITANKKPSKPLSQVPKNRHSENFLAMSRKDKITRGIGGNLTSKLQSKVSQQNKTNQNKSSLKENIHSPKKVKLLSTVTIVRRSQPRYNFPVDLRPKPKITITPAPEIRLTYSKEARLAWRPLQKSGNLYLKFDENLGIRTSAPSAIKKTPREIVIGVDFGTSSTKVVIGDRSLKEAYAVPFLNAVGVAAYLLPSHLSSDGEYYKLEDADQLHNDLKLSMLADPSNPVKCARVCAFLALVIRASRAWLFQERGKQYLRSDILWSLAIGQPADQATSHQSYQLFRKLGDVAWRLAGQTGRITVSQCIEEWCKERSALPDSDEVEILVMPEIAAQIHGFVSSEQFDPKHPNIYLMVDVGAGTVDASVFKVEKTSSGTTSFNFFTNSVETYGVVNLHRYRVRWWHNHLMSNASGMAAAAELSKVQLNTEYRGFFPVSYKDYIEGVNICSIGNAKSPDDEFFSLVLNQVAGKVLYRTKKENLLPTESISGMPFFLCGGGSRHEFYKRLKSELKRTPGCSWLNALHRELTLPDKLRAEGVSRSDYDRLSVAYGLSQLQIGTVKKVEAMQPSIKTTNESKWLDSYVTKDAC